MPFSTPLFPHNFQSSYCTPLFRAFCPPPRSNSHQNILTYLVEIKHQIQLTHIPKEAIQDLNEEVYSLQIRQLVIIGVDADAEEEACVAPVDDLVVAELDEVGLVFLIAGCDEAVDLGE